MRSSPPPFFLLPPFLRPSAHSGPRFPAFTAVRHSHPLLHSSISTSPLLRSFTPPLFFLLPPSLRPSAHSGPRFPAFPAVQHSPPLLRSFTPPFFFFSFPSSLRPFGTPFSRVPRRAALPSAPSRQVLTDNRERGRQPCRRSCRTKKSGPHGPDSIGYQSVFQKKRGDYISRIRMLSPNIIKAVRTH